MSNGLRVWNASGRLILSESSITSRLIGTAEANISSLPYTDQTRELIVYGGEIANDGRTFFKFEGQGYLIKTRVISVSIGSGYVSIQIVIPYHGILGQELVKNKLSVFRF